MEIERYNFDITTVHDLFENLTNIIFYRGLDFMLDNGIIIYSNIIPSSTLYFGINK